MGAALRRRREIISLLLLLFRFYLFVTFKELPPTPLWVAHINFHELQFAFIKYKKKQLRLCNYN